MKKQHLKAIRFLDLRELSDVRGGTDTPVSEPIRSEVVKSLIGKAKVDRF